MKQRSREIREYREDRVRRQTGFAAWGLPVYLDMYKALSIDRFFMEIEEGPVVLIATRYRGVDNVMCLSWLMPLGFSADECDIALMTGPWNKSFDSIVRSRVCTINVPTESLMERL